MYVQEERISLPGKLIFPKTVLLKLPTPELVVILRIFELFLLSILLICCPTYPTMEPFLVKNAINRHIKPDRATGRVKEGGRH